MRTSLSEKELGAYIAAQINTFFPDPSVVTAQQLSALLPQTLRWAEVCFSAIRKKYFYEDGMAVFSHLHSDQYAMFLYMLGNTASKAGEALIATKTFLLNKMLHGLDAFYGVQLPEIFLFVHPIGTILGNASYANYFTVYQNCSVGSGEDGVYPTFGERVVMYAKASVIGHCKIGDNVVVAANAFVLNSNVPPNSLVTGAYPNLRISPNSVEVRKRKFETQDT